MPNFFLQGRQLQHAAVEKSVEFGKFWVWRIQGKPMKTTFVGLFFIEMFDEKVQRLIFAE